jgi:hypothetical protein
VNDFITGGAADVSVAPSGPIHAVLIATGTSTAGLNSTAQVKVGEEPDRMGLGVSETSLTIGSGTALIEKRSMLLRKSVIIYLEDEHQMVHWSH